MNTGGGAELTVVLGTTGAVPGEVIGDPVGDARLGKDELLLDVICELAVSDCRLDMMEDCRLAMIVFPGLEEGANVACSDNQVNESCGAGIELG